MVNRRALTTLLAVGLALSAPMVAHAKKGHEKQTGGLPGLEARVELDEGENSWAVVNSDGTLVRSFSSGGAVTSSHSGPVGSGTYDVTFAQDVSGCAFIATLGDTGTGFPPIGEIGVSSDAGDLHSVVVQTFRIDGSATDDSFHLYVSCPGHVGD
jgi:hypothetical protein